MEDIKKELLDFHLPRWEELPDFDIYMDQVVYFINQKLAPLYISELDKPITPSMVNNYVKDSIVKPPVKKHYKRYHLAYLIVVSILKRSYSLNEISTMIKVQVKMENSSLALAYDKFGEYFELTLKEILKHDRLLLKNDEAKTSHQRLLLNIIQSVVLKLYAEIELLSFNHQNP